MFAIEGLGDAAPTVQVGTPGKPVVTATPYGLFPYWLSADTAKAPDYYRWQPLPGMAPSRIPAPEGSFSSVQAGKDAMQARNAGVAAVKAATPAATPTFAQLFPAATMTPVPATTPWSLTMPQMGVSPTPIGPTNWGPLPLPGEEQPFWKNPLVWIGAGTVVALGAMLLARRR